MDPGQGEITTMTGTMNSAYNDDETPPPAPVPVQASRSGVLVPNVYCEYPAVPNNNADHDGFAVMVHIKAPALVTVAPLDLVALLDVSESMAGAKLDQVKRAMAFVVDQLGPHDRLSVVAFSGNARQVIPLTRMTDAGKAAAKLAVATIEASTTRTASTNVRAGLDEAANVLSRDWNDVSGVILVSDGHDSCDVVPEFYVRDCCSRSPPTPVHTFALGSDMDAAAAMHSISDATGGTFSFVEDEAVIQDALAQCVAGLKSVTAHDVYLEISCTDEMKVTAVKAGRCKSEQIPYEDGWLNVGELYADEERRILFFLDVPRLDDNDKFTYRLTVSCSYTDVVSGQVSMELPDLKYFIESPQSSMEATDMVRCVEVERELLRVAAAEDMALARDAAESGAFDEAARILDARRESLSRSAPALAGDAMCAAVAAELKELSQRVSDEHDYKKTGRACILASMSSHAMQRGSSSVHFGCVGSSVFATPAMRKMEKLSEMMRKKQEVPRRPPLPKNRSKTGVALGSRPRLEARLASAVPRLSVLSKYRRLLLKR